jgi:hypothetical protein
LRDFCIISSDYVVIIVPIRQLPFYPAGTPQISP